MKKTLLTAALVAGFASVAHAESSVTLYGLVDGGVGYNTQKTTWSGDFGSGSFKTRGFEFKNGVKNGNRWGLKGSEDLGNGTSAIFQLESGFDLGNGNSAQDGRLFGRKAFVGLTGESWGTLTLGRQYNVADDFVAPIDPFGTGWGQAAVGSAFGGSVSARYDNVVKYITPSFSGFQLGLGWTGTNNKDTYRNDVFGTDYETEDKSNGFTFGLGYNNGPIQVGASFDYLRNKETDSRTPLANVDTKVKVWNLGFAYDFDIVKLHLMYGQQNDGAIGGIGLAGAIALPADPQFASFGGDLVGDGYRQKSWLLGLTAPVSEAGKVLFSYTGNNIKNKEEFDGKITSHIFNLGYLHSLSKRTSVYAVASYGQSKLKVNETAFNGQAKLKSTEVVLGLQHRF
ncbi:porin [Advenella faeciporci]|uniref:Porin n=1 Tax=Advenella faeciporci TaxID=797535 RepID=A0A918JR76_9BURK|nr:porin [Advenella faeciporci]GGW94737.1 porin [Advenella faeciporci]